jgi:hypothetical protein
VSDVRAPDDKEKIKIATKWKDWYAAIRPDVQFLDYSESL